MVRATELLHPPYTAAPARAAATLLLLRDTPAGPQVLMTRRSQQARFAPGAYVFPGGQTDADDAAALDVATRRVQAGDAQVVHAVTAIRECFEELGILLARGPDGAPVDSAAVAALDRRAPLFAQCRARGMMLAADGVFTLAHWTTDRDLPRRFDVPFLVARMPAGQEAEADNTEQFEPVWVAPQAALELHAQGRFSMIFPTVRTLERMAPYTSVNALLTACVDDQGTERPLWNSCPRAGTAGGEVRRFMEHETAFGELALVCPDGQPLHGLDWQSARVVPLLRGVSRLTAPNPGPKTGPGTNTYMVGRPDLGFIVIDPGPDDVQHVQRIMAWTGGDIRAIFCTHSHPDHAPAAVPLQAACLAQGHAGPPILGMPSAATAAPSAFFRPDRVVADGERLSLGAPDTGYEVQVCATPGHAANHLCLFLAADGLLFSGDHVLNGSTTVVIPPDGDMEAYLRSLDKLEAWCQRQETAFILPAHGHVLGDAVGSIRRLRHHRLAREARIAAAMQAHPQGGPDDWLKVAYADVAPSLWPLAMQTMLAHISRLEKLGAPNTSTRKPLLSNDLFAG